MKNIKFHRFIGFVLIVISLMMEFVVCDNFVYTHEVTNKPSSLAPLYKIFEKDDISFDKNKANVLNGSAFNSEGTIKLYVDTESFPKKDLEKLNEAISFSENYWNKHLGQQVVIFTNDLKNYDTKIQYNHKNNGTIYGDSNYSTKLINIYPETFTFGQFNIICQVLTHEIGHSMGLNHENSSTNLMSPAGSSQSLQLTDSQISSIQSMRHLIEETGSSYTPLYDDTVKDYFQRENEQNGTNFKINIGN